MGQSVVHAKPVIYDNVVPQETPPSEATKEAEQAADRIRAASAKFDKHVAEMLDKGLQQINNEQAEALRVLQGCPGARAGLPLAHGRSAGAPCQAFQQHAVCLKLRTTSNLERAVVCPSHVVLGKETPGSEAAASAPLEGLLRHFKKEERGVGTHLWILVRKIRLVPEMGKCPHHTGPEATTHAKSLRFTLPVTLGRNILAPDDKRCSRKLLHFSQSVHGDDPASAPAVTAKVLGQNPASVLRASARGGRDLAALMAEASAGPDGLPDVSLLEVVRPQAEAVLRDGDVLFVVGREHAFEVSLFWATDASAAAMGADGSTATGKPTAEAGPEPGSLANSKNSPRGNGLEPRAERKKETPASRSTDLDDATEAHPATSCTTSAAAHPQLPPASSPANGGRATSAFPAYNPPERDKSGVGALGLSALMPYVHHPENFPESVYYYDDEMVAIYDKFGKARYHLLFMPRRVISSIYELQPSDIPLLCAMQEKAKQVANSLPAKQIRIGFHKVPSMRQVHMHMISQDFDSPCLKNKKHWNSFTTSFFVSSEELIELLQTQGRIDYNKEESEQLLKAPLACHVCHSQINNIPALKKHITAHNALY
ncbi:aprataxin [Pelomyxa schiedti]|nr:aprataxin [Pelomyxa schiedti]